MKEFKWTNMDILKWKTWYGDEYIFKQKEKFVRHYAVVIKDAAQLYDIPVILLAGVAYSEFGGEPMWIDDAAYIVRGFEWYGPKWLGDEFGITKEQLNTSFGNTSVQVRRALETLGYRKYTEEDKENVIKSLKNPIENIYIAAKHLNDLKDVDYSDKSVEELTDDEIKVIASKYNLGPDVDLETASNWSYGNNMYNHIDIIRGALE